MTTTEDTILNGIDTGALRQAIESARDDASLAKTSWHVATTWQGGTRSDTRVTRAHVGGQQLKRDFTLSIDEPRGLCGTDQFANPQEYLLAGLNACMTVGYVAGCSVHGITLHELRIETEGDIDLRGMFQLDDSIVPGYDSLRLKVHIKADASREQLEKIHETVLATSPNFYNLSKPVKVSSTLVLRD